MNKKRVITLVAMVALIVTLGATTAMGYVSANKYKMNLEYNYKRAMGDLSGCVSNIEIALNKASYANTMTQQNGLAAKLMRESSMAKSALAVLPITDHSLDNVTKFVTQVGDFSMTLSNKISAGQKISDEEYKTMSELEQYAKTLQSGLQNVKTNIESNQLSDEFKKTAEDFTNFPSLIYDGPFSDHINQLKPKLTEGRPQIAQGNAQNIAAEFLGVTQDKLQHTQDTAGGLPTYNFTANNGSIRICVTKAGGFISSMENSRDVTAENLSYEDASKKSASFLQGRGISDMKQTYYVINDGICTINYAYYKNDVIYYPDLIKVSVALDNGEILLFNSTGYIMNHHDRTIQAKITADQAQASVSKKLTVQKRGLALIPTPGLSEVLTYEFLCSGQNNERVLVYINATTGMEEQILILQTSDNGILTK
ncbi:germination protein YpeB [Caproiciproducens faecalis]|uniref:Germination protein YpeB n=1 Tax=Caproiciproducens faecalis TaxID=2820301 RepID=A0ABS7DNL5_9FIRM|nr:germination protein YpeB [Caproiciproducens faecalis]MBW7572699.1 germination protein YpeB [Caproiciproducens faecalis]